MSDNILSEIPGEVLGSAGYELPDAASSADGSLRVTVRLPDGTRAEVVFVKLSSKKGRSTRWFWTPDSAVLIEEFKALVIAVALEFDPPGLLETPRSFLGMSRGLPQVFLVRKPSC